MNEICESILSIGRWDILQIVLCVCIVVTFKAVRMYIVLFEDITNKKQYLIKYMLTTLVNILIPFKLGEIYRGFSYSRITGSYAKGYVAVIFDRFMDTLALDTVSIPIFMYSCLFMPPIYVILTIFIIMAVTFYLLFPSFYLFWNHVLILRRNTKNTLRGLKLLEIIKNAMKDVFRMVKGKFVVLLLLSLFAWIAELYATFLYSHHFNADEISVYLLDIIKGNAGGFNILYFCICTFLFAPCLVLLAICRRKQK